MTIEEKAKEIADRFRTQSYFDSRCNDLVGNIAYQASCITATEQQKIDIKKACKAVCSFCQDKEQCDAESWDAIENTRLAVSCEKIDKIFEAIEE